MAKSIESKKIMVVEDDPHISVLLREILKEAGYDVASFGDAEAALEASLEKAPDLVVTDFRLPKMTGIQFIRQFRREVSTTIPFLLTTAYPDCFGDNKQDLAIIKLIMKPYMLDELLETIRESLGGVSHVK